MAEKSIGCAANETAQTISITDAAQGWRLQNAGEAIVFYRVSAGDSEPVAAVPWAGDVDGEVYDGVLMLLPGQCDSRKATRAVEKQVNVSVVCASGDESNVTLEALEPSWAEDEESEP